MKKILVTGGAGFIGSHVTPYLLKKKYDVSVLDDLSNGKKENIPEGVNFFQMSMRDEAMAALLAEEKFDAVIHLAGQTAVPISVDDPLFDAQLNIGGTLKLLHNAHITGIKRIIFSSTAAVYGDNSSLPLRESESAALLSFYGLSKFAAEEYIKMYNRYFGIDYIIFRFANVYGERQGDVGEGGVISIFAKRIAQDKDIKIFGDGMQTRDFIYAGDIARGIEKALRTKSCNDTYNLSTCTQTSINDLIDLFGDITGQKVTVHCEAARQGDILRSILDNSKSVAKLNWQPEIKLRQGLDRTFCYFQDRRRKEAGK